MFYQKVATALSVVWLFTYFSIVSWSGSKYSLHMFVYVLPIALKYFRVLLCNNIVKLEYRSSPSVSSTNSLFSHAIVNNQTDLNGIPFRWIHFLQWQAKWLSENHPLPQPIISQESIGFRPLTTNKKVNSCHSWSISVLVFSVTFAYGNNRCRINVFSFIAASILWSSS